MLCATFGRNAECKRHNAELKRQTPCSFQEFSPFQKGAKETGRFKPPFERGWQRS